MVAAAQRARRGARARQRALEQMEAESPIDIEAASVDGVLCRWGYMLLADPEAALRETRRVLRPGGRLALAVWERPRSTLDRAIRRGAGRARPRSRADAGAPGHVRARRTGRVAELLAGRRLHRVRRRARRLQPSRADEPRRLVGRHADRHALSARTSARRRGRRPSTRAARRRRPTRGRRAAVAARIGRRRREPPARWLMLRDAALPAVRVGEGAPCNATRSATSSRALRRAPGRARCSAGDDAAAP